eukprot:CAMPEP_0197186250 /NCGR_PEP_ID=MMETSP1423-20130617/13532_1 /TAXON_ID=476441 /ORGANISM="Pseudo-nitzschia heimii, Strain UNC1101" /LENGTH=487 /DNA_ID=CAMNT_0042637505 /DNA_START=54 /DNA_END=1517 /DNA_ORIENTATION=+
MTVGSSSTNGMDFPINPKAAEAELISKATQTAIVAARSILMSGGTEESALKTAKAAAESVLNPAASDSETVSGRSTLGSAFGGRKRKAKRQAEVVASMALMSATSLHPNGNSGMSECDSLNKMYGRNIITVRQDEPSVLSGSTRPPKPPTPKSFVSQSAMVDARSSCRSQQDETREPIQKIPTSPQYNQVQMASQQSIVSTTLAKILTEPVVEEEQEDVNVHPTLNIRTLSASSSEDSERDSSLEPSFLSRSESEDDSDEDTSSLMYREKKEEKADGRSKAKTKTWSLPEALLSPLTATLNMLHCGQITSSDALNDVELMSSYRSKRNPKPQRNAREEAIFDRRDDTFDDENTTSFDYRESPKKKGIYRDPDFMTSYSYTSSHSEISDGSEADIQVRSSIRDTMESIVNKSRLSYQKLKLEEHELKGKNTSNLFNQWETFEKSPKGADEKRTSAVLARSSPKNNSKNKGSGMRRRAQSFFKRDKGRR